MLMPTQFDRILFPHINSVLSNYKPCNTLRHGDIDCSELPYSTMT